jgi:hypothetical protein
VPPDIRAAYAARLADRERTSAALARRDDALARTRLAVFVAGGLLLWGALRGMIAAAWIVAPAAVFVALVVLHARTRAAHARVRRGIDFYRRGIARIDECWAGMGTTGERHRDPHHPYVDDLDLFGPGSLFELLCTCRTRPGEDRLAAWLATPAAPVEIRERQAAAAEIGGAIELREDLAALGDDARSEVDRARIVAWAAAPLVLASPIVRALAFALGVAAGVALGAWIVGAGPAPLVVTMILALPLHALVGRRSQAVVKAVEEPVRALVLAAALFERTAAAALSSPRLAALRRTLATGASPPVPSIRRLRRLIDLLDAQRNPLFAPIALAALWPVQIAFAIEAWRRRHGAAVAGWLDTLGELEALVALGTYTVEHPDDALPTLVDGRPCFDAEALGHPLLPVARCVRNDLVLEAARPVLVVSGSNMSGKSTLLRAVGVNAVLALMGAPVRAAALRLSPLAIGASIRTLDSLREGTSRFYAEITRIRQLVDLAEGPRPLLFLLDEILHGTNSHDRRIGADAIVRGLVRRGAIGLVTTHDLALAGIADDPAVHARNVHFADHVEDARMVFDYRMRDGVVTHSNALALMRAVGLEV